MDAETIRDMAAELATQAANLFEKSEKLANATTKLVEVQAGGVASDPFLSLFTVFVLACFVGFYVVWSVTPALHSPLMAVTNAISSVIIVGALIAAGPGEWNISKTFGFIAVILASVNIFGGFIVTQRMLSMFRAKK